MGQYRVEVDTSPGTAQSYILTVLQAKDASQAPAFFPAVAEDGTSFTVTLNGSTSIVFAKGMASSSRSITVGGAHHALPDHGSAHRRHRRRARLESLVAARRQRA